MHPLPIGKTDDPFDSGRVLTIPPDARRKHIAVFGKSGVAKSTLLRNMIACDIEHGTGVAVQDPARQSCGRDPRDNPPPSHQRRDLFQSEGPHPRGCGARWFRTDGCSGTI